MPFSSADLAAIGLTLRLAGTTMVLLLVLCTPLAWWLAHTRSRWRGPVSAVVALPLVLPPTVIGFYLLITLGPQGPIGQFTQSLGLGTLALHLLGPGGGLAHLFAAVCGATAAARVRKPSAVGPLEAAATLGAGPDRPVLYRGAAAGAAGLYHMLRS